MREDKLSSWWQRKKKKPWQVVAAKMYISLLKQEPLYLHTIWGDYARQCAAQVTMARPLGVTIIDKGKDGMVIA